MDTWHTRRAGCGGGRQLLLEEAFAECRGPGLGEVVVKDPSDSTVLPTRPASTARGGRSRECDAEATRRRTDTHAGVSWHGRELTGGRSSRRTSASSAHTCPRPASDERTARPVSSGSGCSPRRRHMRESGRDLRHTTAGRRRRRRARRHEVWARGETWRAAQTTARRPSTSRPPRCRLRRFATRSRPPSSPSASRPRSA